MNTTYYVTVVPLGAQGSATGCPEMNFIAKNPVSVPSCIPSAAPLAGPLRGQVPAFYEILTRKNRQWAEVKGFPDIKR
ncbi:hypothetical protein [Sinomicrobium soli]|uniref:hypothetical protein n=1 Tax=Sinomicrobium sp. N-1-3-6 TaxID=2219864 RepID=UPI000DCD5F26|nr:hypothetical protein [Sinomicrobium sp. N-1-3-6]RAV28417.1 hypothetical protein DN748_13615 [Sinomicrobium sp. N-1-3-6]